ncbi:MAG: FMN-binding protein [Spirochaetia bacterium]
MGDDFHRDTNQDSRRPACGRTGCTCRCCLGHIEITFEDGEMADVEYDEVKKEGRKVIARKTEDDNYAERWETKSYITPEEAYDELEERLLTAEIPSGVDAVTGATGTSTRFVQLAQRALAKRQEATVP